MTTAGQGQVDLPLLDRRGAVVATLSIDCLPGQEFWNGIPQLLDLTGDIGRDLVQAPTQLLEDCEYSYRIDVEGPVALEPAEVFNPDDDSGRSGRLRPGRATGTVPVWVGGPWGEASTELEMRSRKLGYLSEYRWMLQRIAEEAAELIMQKFAAAGLAAFRPLPLGDARTLYQRFAFIQALLGDESFQGSIQQVLRRPHHGYVTQTELADPTLGLRADRQIARLLIGSGPRSRLPAGRTIAGLDTVPEQVARTIHAETIDTVPNRFVRFALRGWKDLAETVEKALRDGDSPAARRGVREAATVRDQLSQLLLEPLFAEVGELVQFPASNQVLQRREGYRDIYRAFLQAEAATALDWEGGDDIFAAGQRDVATLYEYWVFLELARILGTIPGFTLDRKPLLGISGDRLSLELRRGGNVMLAGHGRRRGRHLGLELWFNRRFPHGSSWTETMRPDCSLRITPTPAITPNASVWLHFDAKYRVGSYREILADDPEPADAQTLRPLSQDLMKMHAYRDAIRRTSGAYVLYPGGDEYPLRHRQYHEILPGLGAFVMRPTDSGEVEPPAERSLRQFLEDVFDHVAAEGTSQERADFWAAASYREEGQQMVYSSLLTEPAADTTVLLGYVKSDEHLAWIQGTGLYNLRADHRRGSVGLSSPEVGADLVVLYRPEWSAPLVLKTTGFLCLRTASQLEASGYPGPSGSQYLCLGVHAAPVVASELTLGRVLEFARRGRDRADWAAPLTVTWARLAGGAGG